MDFAGFKRTSFNIAELRVVADPITFPVSSDLTVHRPLQDDGHDSRPQPSVQTAK
jgi:hypothetical protein